MTTPPPIFQSNPKPSKHVQARLKSSLFALLVLTIFLIQSSFSPAHTAELPDEFPKMYWTDDTADKIQRANLDGSNIEDLVMTGLSVPRQIALDTVSGKMYWVDNGTDKIQRANLDGSNIEDLVTTGLSVPIGIALDTASGKMYWTDNETDKIQRANLDGSNIEDLVTTGLSIPLGIALDTASGKMYWTDNGTDRILRANLDGSNVEDLVTTGLSFPHTIALDTVAGKMYWTDLGAKKIQRANLDGSNVEDLVTTGLSTPEGMTLDIVGGKMYWVDSSARKIQRANLDGSNVEDIVITGLFGPSGIALDTRTSNPPTATPTNTSTPLPTNTFTPPPTATSTQVPVDTPTPPPTDTPPAPPTNTPPSIDTPTPPPANTPAPTNTPSGTGGAGAQLFLPLVANFEPPPEPGWQRYGGGDLRTVTSLAVQNAQLYAGDRGSSAAPDTKGLYATSLANCNPAQAFNRVATITNEILDLAMTDGIGLAAGFSDGAFYLDGNGQWQQSLTGVGGVQSVAIADAIGYAGVEANMYQSATAGITWNLLVSIPLVSPVPPGDIPPNLVNEIVRVGNLLWIGTNGQGVYFWGIDDGILEARSNGLEQPGSQVVWDILLRRNLDLDEFYIATQDGVYTGQGLTSWSQFGQGLEGKSIRSLAQTETTLYAGTVDNGIYQIEFADAGTWTQVTAAGAPTSPAWTVRDLLYDDVYCNGLLAATDAGAWLLR